MSNSPSGNPGLIAAELMTFTVLATVTRPVPTRFPPKNCNGWGVWADSPPPSRRVSPAFCWLMEKRKVLVCTSTVPVLTNWKSMEVAPEAAVPFVFAKTPALTKVGVAPAPDMALPSKVLINVAPSKLLNTAPLAPIKLPALQMASLGFTNLPPLSVTPPLMFSPPLAVTSELVMVPPPRVSRPVTVIGLVPPSVPPVRFTTATLPELLKFTTLLAPLIFRIAPVRLQVEASVAVPAVTLNVEPVSKAPLAVRVVALPLMLRTPAPVTKELLANTWLPPPKFRVAPRALLMVLV